MIRRLLLLLLSMATFGFGQSFDISPIIFGIHRQDGGLWAVESEPITLMGWGIRGNLEYGKIRLETEQVLTRFFGLGRLPLRFNPEQSFSYGQNATDATDEYDIDYSSFSLEWHTDNFRAFIGKTSTNLGPAEHSLMLSEKIPSFPQFGFQWQINDRLNYHFIRGELFSGIDDPYQSDAAAAVPGTPGTRKTYMNRFFAAHRLDITLLDNLSIGFSESLVYGGRSTALIYSLPFMLLYSAEHFFRDSDNLQMSGDITWYPTAKLKLYSALLIDEWKPQHTFKKVNRNWFAWQFGFEFADMMKDNDLLHVEFIWTDHRVYRHRFPINDLYSHYVPVGAWIGPHAQSVIANYTIPIGNSFIDIEYLYAKRGELVDTMLADQYRSINYPRFGGETEELNRFSLIFFKEIKQNWWVEFGGSLIDWTNAGYDPTNPSLDYDDISKSSITVGLFHNFSIPNYKITNLLRRINP